MNTPNLNPVPEQLIQINHTHAVVIYDQETAFIHHNKQWYTARHIYGVYELLSLNIDGVREQANPNNKVYNPNHLSELNELLEYHLDDYKDGHYQKHYC
ncbi:hypothetical protein ACK30J_04960 [Aeromonas caviae]